MKKLTFFKRVICTIIFVLTLNFIAYSQAKGDQFTAESLKEKLLQKWEWLCTDNLEALKSLFHENYSAIRHDDLDEKSGGHLSKDKYLKHVKDNEIDIIKAEPYGELKVKLVDNNIGIIFGKAKSTYNHNGKRKEKIINFSDVYVFKNNQWQELFWHSDFAENKF